MGKNKFFNRTGFLGIPEDHRDTVLDCLIKAGVLHAGAPRELVIWKSGVIHTEMKQSADGGLSFVNDKKTTTERYIVGTHQPYNLTQQQLQEIGFLADKGFLFASYNNLNEDNAAGTNSVHLKKTLWKPTRNRPQSEKDRLGKRVRRETKNSRSLI
jgi:hypothetical protein